MRLDTCMAEKLRAVAERARAGASRTRSLVTRGGLGKRATPPSPRNPSGDAFVCPLCNDTIERHEWVTHQDIESYVLSEIRRLHPEWIDDRGCCRPCLDAYRNL